MSFSVVPEYYQENTNLGFSHSRGNKRARTAKQEIAKKGQRTVITSWKGFGSAAPVYMTSRPISHYLLGLDAEQLRPGLGNGKYKENSVLASVWKQLEQADVIV